jgi:Gpi18-like mannosyltransferase
LSINWRPDHFAFSSWWETFTVWDGGWYNLIAEHWYNTIPLADPLPMEQLFAFPPLFPSLIRGLGFLIGSIDISQVIVSSFFGITWIPLFQLVAEKYLDHDQAFSVTLIASLFPLVFLFTSVGYSEGLFLTLTLSSYYLYLKNRHFPSSLLLAAACLTRLFGVLLFVPMILDRIANRRYREVLVYFIPVLTLLSWFFYAYIKTGNLFAIFYSQAYWGNNKFVVQYVLPTFFQTEPAYSFSLPVPEALVGFVICVFSVFCLLSVKVRELDWKLALYSFLTFLVVTFVGNIPSYPRYFSFIFPVWLLFRTKRRFWLIPIICILAFTDVIIMYLFARWTFLG